MWKIAKVWSKGVHSAWGAECQMHSNSTDNVHCKKQLGISGGLTSEECRLRMMAWLLEGTSIARDSDTGRTEHVHEVKPRQLLILTEQEYELQALAYWAAYPP